MRKDVMVDIETLGTSTDSTIIQIAAVSFDIKTGYLFDKFNMIADIEKNENVKVNGSTLKWWVKTNQGLLNELLHSGTVSSEDLLREFYLWVTGLTEDIKDVYLWGNGILFDNNFIKNQFESISLKYPIYYRNDRDVRTILDLAANKRGITENELKEKYKDASLVEHDAYDDVIYQINLVCGCYNYLIQEGI